ncbi:uncharacterized protein LY89DRAFT_594845 [Mollisia scopiformis]|uniref:Uncharacterized protein n=1 Tax=Mollisia scopiformis TaxID=149040 RepID=A0A194WST0_MOLSC|nr:uncharacterized protein LY89DRAFT_594845 [Mollisia scopiformis]KUJ11015.1 hypothetical protein LY89DRAFT_594845 [Mollisia scopiformis]
MQTVRRKHFHILSFTAGFAASIVLGVIALSIYRLTSVPKARAEIEAESWNYCGRSSVTAMSRGCVMEPMFYGWMPPQCVYQELTESLPVFEDRKYFSDANLTQPIQVPQLWAGEHNVIYTDRYHDEHCLFQWRKLEYAYNHQMDFIDNKTISMHHSKHCADQLSISSEIANGPRANYIELGFYRCRKTIW